MLPVRSPLSPRTHWRNRRQVRRRASGRTVAYNLRLPGQIFDGQAGLHYNWHRWYDPATGGYAQSDPLGLSGGSSTYPYVDDDPLRNLDPLGLFDWPSIPDPIYNFSVGVADDLSWGIGPLARAALGIDGGVNRCSNAYKAGQYAALAIGAGRIGYAGAVKAVSLAPGVSGAAASAFRNAAKRVFRGPFAGSDYRMYSYEQLLEKYGSDAAVKAKSGQTDPLLNAIGADAAAGGAIDSASECGCK